MAITTELTKESDSSVKLNISVEAEDVNKAFENAYKDLIKKVKIKGFRPGKAPIGIIRKRYGSAVSADVLNDLINDSFCEATKEKQIRPVNSGSLDGDIKPIEEGKSYSFCVKVDVYPEVELPEYHGVSAIKNTYKVTDKDLENELIKLQKRFATLEDVKNGAVEKNSFVQIKYDVVMDKEKVDKLSGRNFNYDQESGSSYPDLKNSLIGKKKGETITVKSKMPENFPDKEMSSKNVEFVVDIEKIQKLILPDLNDEFVQKISSYKVIDEFKEILKNNMIEEANQKESIDVQNEIMQHLIKKTKMDIPKSMIESEIDVMIQTFTNNLGYARSTMEQYLESTGKTEAELRDSFTDAAENQVKSMIILSEIEDKENIKATNEEIDREIQIIAEKYNQPPDQTRKILEEGKRMSGIRYDIRKNKTLNFLEKEAKIKSGKTLNFSDIEKNRQQH